MIKAPEVTESDLTVARWRMINKYRIRHQDVDDYLSEALVTYYEQQPEFNDDIDKYSIGNWLSLIAFRRSYDFQRKLSTRKSEFIGSRDWIGVSNDPSNTMEREEIRMHALSMPENLKRDALAILLGKTLKEEAAASSRTKQAICIRLSKSKYLIAKHFDKFRP